MIRGSLSLPGKLHVQCTEIAFRDGTTHVIFQPLDFFARLAVLLPQPRVHLTRFHGVLVPNSGYCAR